MKDWEIANFHSDAKGAPLSGIHAEVGDSIAVWIPFTEDWFFTTADQMRYLDRGNYYRIKQRNFREG
mgnify:CR=1 FL=1